MDSAFDNWTVQLRKGVLELCILSYIGREEECYGYELTKQMAAIPGLEVSEGSIYPLLSRLCKQGVVQTELKETSNGPARKYYRLTVAGRARMVAMQEYYQTLGSGIDLMLKTETITKSEDE